MDKHVYAKNIQKENGAVAKRKINCRENQEHIIHKFHMIQWQAAEKKREWEIQTRPFEPVVIFIYCIYLFYFIFLTLNSFFMPIYYFQCYHNLWPWHLSSVLKNETFNTVIPFVVFWLKWVNPFSPRCFPKFAKYPCPSHKGKLPVPGGKVTFVSLFFFFMYMQIGFAHSVHWTLRGSGLSSSLKINEKKKRQNVN